MADSLYIAKNIKEAVSYIKKGSTILAGGTQINRLDSPVKAKSLVSIGRIEGLDKIEKTAFEGVKYIKIGSMCTFQEAVESTVLPQYFKDACLNMSSRTKRNMATIGGNIASLRDDSYILAMLLCCKAKLEVINKSSKTSVIELCTYVSETDKYKDFLITGVFIPASKQNIAQKRYANTASSHGYITMAMNKNKKEYTVGLCVKNSGIYTFGKLGETDKVTLKDDMFGSKEYKKYLLKITEEDLVKVLGGAK